MFFYGKIVFCLFAYLFLWFHIGYLLNCFFALCWRGCIVGIPTKTSGYELNIPYLNASSILCQISGPWKLFSISVQMIINDDYEYCQTQSQSISTTCVKIPGSFNLQGIHKMDPSWGLCRKKATKQPHSHWRRIPETGYGILRNSWFSLHSLTDSLPHTSNKYILVLLKSDFGFGNDAFDCGII